MVIGLPSEIDIGGVRLAKRITRAMSWCAERPVDQMDPKICVKSWIASVGNDCNSSALQPSMPTAL